jgi:hypothetical protein
VPARAGNAKVRPTARLNQIMSLQPSLRALSHGFRFVLGVTMAMAGTFALTTAIGRPYNLVVGTGPVVAGTLIFHTAMLGFVVAGLWWLPVRRHRPAVIATVALGHATLAVLLFRAVGKALADAAENGVDAHAASILETLTREAGLQVRVSAGFAFLLLGLAWAIWRRHQAEEIRRVELSGVQEIRSS